MLKRYIALAVVCALLFQVCGCTMTKMIPPNELEGEHSGRVLVLTADGAWLSSDIGTSVVYDDTLYTMIDGQDAEIPVSDIRVLQVRKFSTVTTGIGVLAGFVIFGSVMMAILWY